MQKLLTILQDLHPEVDFLAADHLIDDGILDSFDIVTLVAEIDEAYGVSIPAEALVAVGGAAGREPGVLPERRA